MGPGAGEGCAERGTASLPRTNEGKPYVRAFKLCASVPK